jgi:hypothetical protein
MERWLPPTITLLAAILYWLAVAVQEPAMVQGRERPADVVVSAPVQVLMYGGDRFLAAETGAIQAAASVTRLNADNYRLRLHTTVSRLNPCHEDNYWIGNASLTWGGSVQQGLELLRNAMNCRFWDEWPAFYYGFSQEFFLQDVVAAQQALELAAQRSSNNTAAFRTYAIMLAAGKIDNTRAAIKMIKAERDSVKEPELRDMLNDRLIRLEGLLTLRDAQATYEKRFGKPLKDPQQLRSSGVIQYFPVDPVGVGYEFRDKVFHLRQLKIE